MADIIHYAIPGFILLLLVEVGIAVKENKDWFEARDTFSSLAMGIGNVIIGLFTKGVVLAAMAFVYQFRIFEIGFQWWAWLLLVFAEDFTYYWYHRVSHSSRYFWASHVVHHSSRRYNLGTALRQTWTGEIAGGFLFWLWLPLLGFHPSMVFTMQAISLLYQFWIHTEAISKMPYAFELVFNTPSHHRVHHSSDIKYLDKNHAGIFIIWDRFFGTFQEEEEHPVYGLTKNISTYNPLRIAFHEWAAMLRDLGRAPSWRAAFGYLFGPPGWSHDGSRLTTAQLREKFRKSTAVEKNPVKGEIKQPV
ncbi:MAG: sterol desaturase family protein [Phaeodactylibacter sp.]|nr:sterol desaturase family protein [Phaeodactylibacter sp.]MCB9289837.1 sterol desaturase family protein [Lewinellaceae bacterium]